MIDHHKNLRVYLPNIFYLKKMHAILKKNLIILGGVKMDFEKKLEELGFVLPVATKPLGSYVPYKIVGNMIHLSGQGPFIDGRSIYSGKVGGAVSQDQGYEAARVCALNLLAQLKAAVGSLDNIKQIISVKGYVASESDFTGHPSVINGASDLLVNVFGESGKHVRCALGANVLPVDIPVEIEMVAELKD